LLALDRRQIKDVNTDKLKFVMSLKQVIKSRKKPNCYIKL